MQEAARVIGLQLRVLHASTSREIDAAFATFGRERPDALFVTGDGVCGSRRVQLANWRPAIGFRQLIRLMRLSQPAG